MAASPLISANRPWPVAYQRPCPIQWPRCTRVLLRPDAGYLHAQDTQGPVLPARSVSTCLHCPPGSHPSGAWAWCPQAAGQPCSGDREADGAANRTSLDRRHQHPTLPLASGNGATS